jgi:hypothetical protein
MKLQFLLPVYFLAALNAHAQIEVPRSESPGGEFVVKISMDKDLKGYESDSAPKLWIEEKRSKQKLAEFEFGADPESDMQPLRSHTKVLWNSVGDAIAIQFQERHYSNLVVYRLKGSLAVPESFVPCALPKDGEIIQRLVPRFGEFRSRWFQHPDGWVDRHTLLFTAGSGAIMKPKQQESGEDVNFMAVYRFSIDYKDPHTPSIKRIELVDQE